MPYFHISCSSKNCNILHRKKFNSWFNSFSKITENFVFSRNPRASLNYPCNSEWQRYLSLSSAAGWPKIWGPHEDIAWSPSRTFWECITLLLGAETLGPLCQKEGSLKATWETPKLIREDMHALGNGTLKNAKIFIISKGWIVMLMKMACWNNKVNWAAQKGFIQDALAKTCHFLLFKLT